MGWGGGGVVGRALVIGERKVLPNLGPAGSLGKPWLRVQEPEPFLRNGGSLRMCGEGSIHPRALLGSLFALSSHTYS